MHRSSEFRASTTLLEKKFLLISSHKVCCFRFSGSASGRPDRSIHFLEPSGPGHSVKTSVADPDPNLDPDLADPYVFGLLEPDPLVRGMDLDPDPSIIKQK
jgi:hypothetical protein